MIKRSKNIKKIHILLAVISIFLIVVISLFDRDKINANDLLKMDVKPSFFPIAYDYNYYKEKLKIKDYYCLNELTGAKEILEVDLTIDQVSPNVSKWKKENPKTLKVMEENYEFEVKLQDVFNKCTLIEEKEYLAIKIIEDRLNEEKLKIINKFNSNVGFTCLNIRGKEIEIKKDFKIVEDTYFTNGKEAYIIKYCKEYSAFKN